MKEQIVFDKFWFERHQDKLVRFANTWIGKKIFGFKKMGHYLENKIVKITPYSVAEFIGIKGKKIELREHFFSRNEYARRLYLYLYPVWLFMHIWDFFTADYFRLAPQLNFGFSTLTAYPDASPLTSCDGYVERSGVNESFSSIHSGNGTYYSTSRPSIYIDLICSGTTNQFSLNTRSIMNFDTSTLTSSATISSAILSLWGRQKITSTAGTPDLHISASSSASNTSLASSDYQTISFTSFASMSWDSFNATDSQYNDFTLNASGISNISKIGVSKFAWVTSWDINNNFTGTWSSGYETMVTVRGANSGSGTSRAPKLVVTYTVVTDNGSPFFAFI